MPEFGGESNKKEGGARVNRSWRAFDVFMLIILCGVAYFWFGYISTYKFGWTRTMG